MSLITHIQTVIRPQLTLFIQVMVCSCWRRAGAEEAAASQSTVQPVAVPLAAVPVQRVRTAKRPIPPIPLVQGREAAETIRTMISHRHRMLIPQPCSRQTVR